MSVDALAATWRALPGGPPYFDTYEGHSGLLSTAGKFVPTLAASFSKYTTSEYDRGIPSRKGIRWAQLARPLPPSGAAPLIQQSSPQVPKSPPTSFTFVTRPIYYSIRIDVPALGLGKE